MTCTTSGQSQEKRERNVINRYIYHFYSLVVEARFYGDWSSDWLFYEVKQQRSQLVPGWVTAVPQFVEDPVSSYKIINSKKKKKKIVADSALISFRLFRLIGTTLASPSMRRFK